jgi:hypothetical protein
MVSARMLASMFLPALFRWYSLSALFPLLSQ